MGCEILYRRMNSVTGNGPVVLDVVADTAADGGPIVTLFLAPGADIKTLKLPKGAKQLAAFTIGEAPVIRLALPEAGPFEFAGHHLTPDLAEPALMAGRNVLAATRNGETAQVVADWLHWHVTRAGADAAVILDRAPPGGDDGFDKTLAKLLKNADFDARLIILRAPLPLGKPDLPPEAHPFNAPAAPGKDRMDLPDPDPQTSPLGVLSIYEILRARFLNGARAVANLDCFDLLTETGGRSVFDRAVNSETGLIQLQGHPCYPWRIRPNDTPTFGDHICTQFDAGRPRNRWCLAPDKTGPAAVWRLVRLGNAVPDPSEPPARFRRFMALRHAGDAVSRIVPKTALIEDEALLTLARQEFDHNPVRVPKVKATELDKGRGRRAIVTCMKNEGPFILEWIAYHKAIGFDDFLVYTNDCTDGTDTMLDLLQQKGIVQHRDNPFRKVNMKPQHAALAAAGDEPVIKDAKWIAVTDVDEFINIKIGDGTLDALFDARPQANMFAMTWRLFGNGDVHDFHDGPIVEQFTRCAPEMARKPHQAWGFKTLFKNLGLFKKLGVHRPKGLNAQLVDQVNWVNGSGQPLPQDMYRNAWRSTTSTFGYDLVQLNHYAVRSAESFLVKRDRGRVNHVDRDQGMAYWFRMNNNAVEERSILSRTPMLKAEMDRLLADPDIAAAHAACVANHRAKIDALRSTENYAKFFEELTGERLENLSRMHSHFGANVFLAGPSCIPPEIAERDPDEKFFFTVERQETAH